MDDFGALSIFLSFLAAFLATSLALSAWQRKSSSWARPFAIMMMALAEWSLTYALQLSVGTPATEHIWRRLQNIGMSIMPVTWFILAAHFSDYVNIVASYRRRLLYILPLLTVLLVSYELRHTIRLFYALCLVMGGTLLLVRGWRQEGRTRQWNTLAILAAALLPWVGYSLQLLGFHRPGTPDLLPVTFVVGAASLTSIVTRLHLFDLVPIARQSVLNNMPSGVIVINMQDRVVDINLAGQAIVARNAAEVIGHRIVEVMPQWSDLWYEALIKGEVHAEIGALVERQERCYALHVTPVYGRGDRLKGRLMMLLDITERKHSESELLSRKQLFENLVAVARATAKGSGLQTTLQNALDVTTGLTGAEYGSLFLLDSNGRVTHGILARGKTAQGSGRKIVGTVMNQGLAGWVVRNRTSALLHDTLEDERWVTLPDQPYAARSVLVVPITSGSEVLGVLTLQHSQTSWFDTEDEALLHAASDQMALALHKAKLYEEQRQLASRQQILYEVLRTVGQQHEPGSVMHLVAETIARLTGWAAVGIMTPRDDDTRLILQAATGILAHLEGKAFSATRGIFGRAFKSGSPQSRLEGISEKSHELAWLQSVIIVPLGRASNRMGVLVVGMEQASALNEDDVLLAESLAETVALAMSNARLQRMRDDLTHTMVHDLRNPLHVVSGTLELVQDRLAPSNPNQIPEMLQIARQSTGRMLHLVNGILSISRLESGAMPLNRSAINLPGLIDQVLHAQIPLAHDKQLKLAYTNGHDQTLLPPIEADEELIERVLQNLVGNAIKFTPAGGTVSVKLETDTVANLVCVGVSDTGPGIPFDIQERLFEKFVTGVLEGKGSGLGLAFCRMAVEAHGGNIWVESSLGHGATFYFTLPGR